MKFFKREEKLNEGIAGSPDQKNAGGGIVRTVREKR